MKIPHVRETVVEARTYENGRVTFDGKTSRVSSGSMWGGSLVQAEGESVNDALRRAVNEHNEWCSSYQRANFSIAYDKRIKYNNKIFLDGKLIPTNDKCLKDFF